MVDETIVAAKREALPVQVNLFLSFSLKMKREYPHFQIQMHYSYDTKLIRYDVVNTSPFYRMNAPLKVVSDFNSGT